MFHRAVNGYRRRVPVRPQVKRDLIRVTPLFAQCSPAEMKRVASIADEVVIPAGTRVIRQGDAGGNFCVVVEGAAEVHRNGRKIRTLAIGDYFGEIALLTRSPCSATVTAATPLNLLVVKRRNFVQLLRTSPQIGVKLAHALAERIEADARQAPL